MWAVFFRHNYRDEGLEHTSQDDPAFDTIADRVEHMAGLGVDAIWLTPENEGGPHGYHTIDYFSTDPDPGTMEDFEALVEECHAHDIGAIFDLIIDHTADSHPFFEAATDSDHPEHEKYVDWYRWIHRADLDAEFYFDWGGSRTSTPTTPKCGSSVSR